VGLLRGCHMTKSLLPLKSSSEIMFDAVEEHLAPDNQRIPDISIVSRFDNNLFQERHWVKWSLMLVDIVALQISLYIGYLANLPFADVQPMAINSSHYFSLVLGMAMVPVGYWLMRLYPGYGFTVVERLRRRVRATAAFLALFISWDLFSNPDAGITNVLLATLAISLILPPMIQSVFRSILIRLNCWGSPVLVLGAAKTGEHVINSLIKNPEMGLRPVAVFDDDPAKAGKTVAGVPVHHGLHHANDLSEKVKYALLAIPGADRDLQLEIVRELRFHHIIIIPDLIGLQSLWVEARDMGGVVGLEIRKNLLLRRNWVIKRSMDYILGVPLFLISVPVLGIIAIWIMIVNPGNPFFSQVREGRGGKKFKVWKLRTMYSDAEKLLHKHLAENPEARHEWNHFFKLKNDPRILKGIGTILRKTSLDELPQLWNVLKGEMSLVGPRPFPHYHLEQFNCDFRNLRRSVIPGMTGMWQTEARSDGDLAVQESLDTYYIRNWSIWLDLSLLGRTILIVLTGKGAY
jgi:Undecaprenyl-phosphate galactose phosphotransferase WbaP